MSVNIFNKSTGSITQIAGNATGGGGTTVTVDNILSTTSENPVQNKVITGELNKKIDSSIKGVANGVAELDSNGKVLTAQLPSYVDDVLEYSGISDFPTEGETGKIYVDTTTNKTYRWSGSTYIEISESIALGETSSTAYRGDRGKIAYDHSQSAHAPADAEANVQSDWNETDPTSDAYILNKPIALPADGGNADTLESHPASDFALKTDIPTSLPANGGNADTLDGLHASDITLSYVRRYKPIVTSVVILDSAVKLKWLPVDNATKYAVSRYDGSGYTTYSLDITDTEYTITGLSNGTEYQFLVQAYIDGKWNSFDKSDHIAVRLPSLATDTVAGLISTGAQTLAGNKTFNGQVIPAGASAVGTAQARKIYAGTSDMTAGTTALETGAIYLVYE